MAQDYRGFQDKLNSDLNQASVTAQTYGDKVGKTSKVRIRHSDFEELIPHGAAVEFIATPCHKLKYGDIIFVRKDKEFAVRRFLAFQMTKGGAKVAVARANPSGVELHADTSVVGKIVGVEAKGEHYDPHKRESLMQRFRNEWTAYGTSTPFQRMVRSFKSFSRLLSKKKTAAPPRKK